MKKSTSKSGLLVYAMLFLFNNLLLFSFLQAQIQWEPDVRLTDVLSQCCGGYIETFGDTIYVVFADNREPAGADVYFIRSTDMGTTWSNDMSLSPLDTNSSYVGQFAVRGETLHVVYDDARYIGTYVIYYRRSVDGGLSWEPETLLSSQWRSCAKAGITLGDSQDVFVIWDDVDDFFHHLTTLKKSTDAGTTWLPENIIDSLGYDSPFGLLYNSQTIHMVIRHKLGTLHSEIFYKRSTDQGITWSDYDVISPNDSAASQGPAMCCDYNGNLYVTWMDYKYSPYSWTGDIFFSKSTDNGLSWLPYKQLTDVHHAQASDVCVSGDSVYVVWDDDRWGIDTEFELYFRMSTDGGETWLTEERLTNALKNSWRPRMVVSKEWVHVIWNDHRDGPYPAYSELYYKRGKRFVGVAEDDQNSRMVYHVPELEIYPNPSRGRLTIAFTLQPSYGIMHDLSLAIYDVAGCLIKRFDHLTMQPSNQIFWDGRDEQGKEVVEGIYFIRADAGEWSATEKIALIRQ